MSWWRGRKYFKDRTRRIFGVDRLAKIEGPMIFSVIQAAGGGALAYYLFDDPTYRILPYMCSAVAVVGTYNVLKIMQKTSREEKNLQRSADIETSSQDRRRTMYRSAWNIGTGIFNYVTNVYVFSEGLKHNDKMWIPAIATAASGYYFTVQFIDNLETNFFRNPIFTCCHRMFEPALIASTATYMLWFRNHEEECLYWLPFVFITAAGYKIANYGFARAEHDSIPKLLLLRAIELLMGGCLLTIGSTVLTVYTSVNDFNKLFIASAAIASFFGAFVIFGSITCFRRYVDLDQDVFFPIVGMIVGPVTFLASCLMVKCVQETQMVYFICLFLSGFGHVIVFKSALSLYRVRSRPVVHRYCQRVLGPELIVYSSIAAVSVGRRMGWRFSLPIMPFMPIGIYVTCKGFRKKNERQ